MKPDPFYPYRSQSARDACASYLDSLAAAQWRIDSEERMVPNTHGATFVRIGGPAGAPPLVLLHGAASSSLMWAPNIDALSTDYRTYAVDQIGDFGKSLCAQPVSSVAVLLAWLNELFDGLELRGGVNLVGMSYGGALAAQFALRFPERLEKLVLLAPGNTVLRTRAEFWARLVWAAVATRSGLRSFFRWIFADMTRRDPAWVDAIQEHFLMNLRGRRRRGTRSPVPPVLTDSEWRSLGVPTLFLVGQHDVIYSAEKAVRRLKRVAPQIVAEMIPGAGHDFTVAHAATVNRKILEFLKPNSAPLNRVGTSPRS